MKSCKNTGKGNFVCHTKMRQKIPIFHPDPFLLLAAMQTLRNYIYFFFFLQWLSLEKHNILVFLPAIWHHRCHTELFGHQRNLLGVFWWKKCALWEGIWLKDMLWLCLSPSFTARMVDFGKHSCNFSCRHTPTCPSCHPSCSSTFSLSRLPRTLSSWVLSVSKDENLQLLWMACSGIWSPLQ